MSTKPASTVSWVYSTTTLTLPIPEQSYALSDETAQTTQQTADGAVYVYDKGFVNKYLDLSWRLTQAQFLTFRTFVRRTIKRSLRTFTYTDHYRDVHAGVRLMGDPQMNKTPGEGYRVTVRLKMQDNTR